MIAVLSYLFAGVAVFGAVGMLFSKNLLHNALLLLLSLLGVAAVYVFAGADFIAVAQIMIYVGGILILLLFGVMFTSKEREEAMHVGLGRSWQGIFVGGSLFALFAYAISETNWLPTVANPNWENTTQTLGMSLMTTHLLPFEAIAILLLLALIGAMNIAAGKRG